MLAWTPSSDNVGVVEYGLYDSGLRVATGQRRERDAHEPRPAARVSARDSTRPTPRATAPRASTPTSGPPPAPRPTSHPRRPPWSRSPRPRDTTVALSWTASTDDVAVTGYGLYLSGSRTSETTGTTGQFTGLKCGTTYTLGVDAKDAAGLRSAPANLSAATSPCTTRRRQLDGLDHPDDRERCDVEGCRELVRRLRRQRRQGRGRPGQRRVASSTATSSAPRSTSRSVTTPASGRPRRLRTAPTRSRCARSTAPAPCSPRTPSPRPSPTPPRRRPARRARSPRRSRTVRR